MDHLCEKTDITLEWEVNERYLVHSRNRTPTPLTKATPSDDRGSCNRDSRGHHAITCDRANKRRVHPSSLESTHSEDFQTKREGGWGGPTGCMFVAPNQPHFRGRRAVGSSPCAPEEEAETIASLPRVWMLVSARMSSLHAVHRKALFATPLMDGSRRAATADGRSSRPL